MKHSVAQKVNEVLDAVDQIGQVEVSSCFKTRVMSSFSSVTKESSDVNFPAFLMMAASIILISVNIFIAKNIPSFKKQKEYSNNTSFGTSINEYQLNSSNYEYIQ